MGYVKCVESVKATIIVLFQPFYFTVGDNTNSEQEINK